MENTRFGSFWFGDRLGFLEQACLRSFAVAGQKLSLYTYSPDLEGLPDNITLCDANDILPLDDRLRDVMVRFPARFSDYFRLLMIAKTGAVWIDCDVYYLKPIKFETNLITIGRAAVPHNHFWNSVLFLEPGSDLLNDYIALCSADEVKLRPGWTMPVNSEIGFEPVATFFERMGKVDFHAAHLPRNFFGPILLSLLASQYNPAGVIRSKTHYPFGAPRLRGNLHDPVGVPLVIPAQSETIHFFGSMVYGAIRRYPRDPTTGVPDVPEGSLIWHAVQGTLHGQQADPA